MGERGGICLLPSCPPTQLLSLHPARCACAEGVLLLDLDGPQWRMVWCNEAFCSAAGEADHPRLEILSSQSRVVQLGLAQTAA